MPEISAYNLYDILDLVETWKNGWKELSRLCYNLGFRRDKCTFPGDPKSRDRLVYDSAALVFDEIVETIKFRYNPFVEFKHLLLLCATSEGKYTVNKHSKLLTAIMNEQHARKTDKHSLLHKSLIKALNALSESDTVGDALERITTRKNYMRYCRSWAHMTKDEIKAFERAKIEPRWKIASRWLIDALEDRVLEEEAWWNCVWIFGQSIVDTLLTIREYIGSNTPLTREQLDDLNLYMSQGKPCGYSIMEHDGSEMYEILLEPDPPSINVQEPYRAMYSLLVEPAFELAQRLQRCSSKPRFIKECRAPSCGRMFYTGRKNAKACPGSQSGKKNKCALQWIRYKRYLAKIGKNPEKDWDNEQLKKDFISYDKS